MVVVTTIPLLFITTLIIAEFTLAAPYFRSRRWKNSVVQIVNDILENQFPQCDIILVQDSYFAENMNSWVARIEFPYYSVTLDGKPFPDYTTWQKITKTTGFLCTTIIVACVTFDSCRNSDSPTLFKMLSANGILLKERRALLYIDNYKEEDGTPYMHKDAADKRSIAYERENTNTYSLEVLNKAKYTLHELNTHITIIRDMTKKINSKKSILRTENRTDANSVDNPELFYETLTFTPNWIPGGSPVVPNLWTNTKGFILPFLTRLNLTQVRPGGLVRFCVASRHLLPFIDVAANGSIRGLGAELIKTFKRQLKIIPEFFEPRERVLRKNDSFGNWSAQIAFVLRKEADIGLGHVIFTHDKLQSGLKFSPPVAVLKAIALCPIPKLLPRFQILAYPFDNPTWICILVACVVSVLIIELLQRAAIALMPGSYSSPVVDLTQKSFTLSPAQAPVLPLKYKQTKLPWIQSIGPILQRSIPVTPLPKHWAILGLFSVWLCCTFITAASYVTLLISALSAPPREPYVHSPADLVQTKSEWAVSTVVTQAIESSSLPMEIKLLKNARNIGNLPEYQNLSPDIQVYSYVNTTGNCGVSEEYRTKLYVGKKFNVIKNNRKLQILYVSKGSFFIGATGWVMRDDMDFMIEAYFDKMFLHLACYGIFAKIIKDWSPEQYKTSDPIEALDFETVRIVFIFGGAGLIGSFLVFLLEVIVYLYKVNAEVSRVQARLLQKNSTSKEEKEKDTISIKW